jgi:hypothetical protein
VYRRLKMENWQQNMINDLGHGAVGLKHGAYGVSVGLGTNDAEIAELRLQWLVNDLTPAANTWDKLNGKKCNVDQTLRQTPSGDTFVYYVKVTFV